jgi:hypothetical protein
VLVRPQLVALYYAGPAMQGDCQSARGWRCAFDEMVRELARQLRIALPSTRAAGKQPAGGVSFEEMSPRPTIDARKRKAGRADDIEKSAPPVDGAIIGGSRGVRTRGITCSRTRRMPVRGT